MVFEGETPHLSRAERAGQPAGPAPAATSGVGPEVGGRHLRRALARDGGGPARHPQGRRRLPAARSRAARPSGWPSCWRTPASRLLLAQERLVPDLPARDGLRRRLAATALRREPGRSRSRGAAGEPGLRHLHLGLDRAAQGGGGLPPRARQPPAVRPHAATSTAADAVLQKTPFSFDVSVWRSSRRSLAGGRDRCSPGPAASRTRPTWWSSSASRGSPTPPSPPALLARAPRAAGVRRAAPACARSSPAARRSPAELPAAVLRGLPGADLLNRYGPTEATIVGHLLALRARGRGAALACRSAGRSAKAARLPARPRAAAGAGGRAGRALHRRRRRWPAAICGRPELTAERFVPDPFARRARGAPLPHRRPRPLPAGRRARVPRPRRPAGQDPRLPRRAGGDRGRARRPPGGARGGGGRRARTAGDPRPRRLPGRPAGAEAAGGAASCGAFLRGAPAGRTWCPRPSWRSPALPLTPSGKVDRRALPAPRAPAAPAARASRRRATPAEELLAGDLGASCSARERVGVARQLLRPRRPLAARHPGGLAGARGASASSCRCALLFEAPTVAGAGRGRRGALRPARPAPPPPLVPAPRGGDLPLSFAQERLWFLDQLAAGQRRLQHPGRRAPARRARRRRPARGACARWSRRHEVAAHHLRRARAAGRCR